MKSVLTACVVASVAGSAAADLTFYTDEGDFLAALTAFQTETFSVADQLVEPGSPVMGDFLTVSANGSDNFFDDAGIFGGELTLAPEAAAHTSYTISGLGGVNAFGGTFTSPMSSSGFGIEFDGVAMTLNGQWSDGGFGTSFLGWISDSGNLVDEFTITNNSFEIFDLDNAHFGVPTPGALGLIGLGGLAAARRRR